MIIDRIRTFPKGQWVAIVKSRIVGVLYTQRIHSKENLLNDVTFDNQHILHDHNGPILQVIIEQ